jgi:hypothetical protein
VFLDIYYNQEHYWKHWGGVWFIYPNFVLETGREYNVCTTYRVPLDIPKNKSGFRDGQELPNIAAFHLIQDGNQNISFWLVNTL